MLIVYHDDYDGVCSAAIAYRKFNREACLIPINYHILFPFDKVASNEDVWILDYSIPVEDMNHLMSLTKHIGLIDHHKSSMQGYGDYPGIRSVDKSACELVWEYFNPKAPISWAIRYIGDRDTWKWQYGDATRHFYNGLQMEADSMNPKSLVWDSLLSLDKEGKLLDTMMQKGMVIEKYKLIQNKRLVETWAYEVEFAGYTCLALNCSNTIDRLSNTLLEHCGHQVAILYTFDGNRYTVSLYSIDPTVDVEVIAKKYGGGGHPHAAGFVINDLPFHKKGNRMNTRGILAEGEPHPEAVNALKYIMDLGFIKLSTYLEAFSSCAIEGNRLGEVCSETLSRLLNGQSVSDRYVLGLGWAIRNMEDANGGSRKINKRTRKKVMRCVRS